MFTRTQFVFLFPFVVIIIFFFSFFPSLSVQQTQPLSTDYQRLMAFREGILNDPTGEITGTWIQPNSGLYYSDCPTNFYGVTCNSDATRVVSISLDNLQLTGVINFDTLAGMNSLVNLTLYNNNLTGFLTSSVASLTSLQLLDLSINKFYGEIPDEISGLSNLNYLKLSFNNFSGVIPTGLGSSQKLWVIDVRGNSLEGDALQVLEGLSGTVYADLGGNFLSGELWVGQQDLSGVAANLKYLDLSWNKLEGRFFQKDILGLFKILVFLDVSYNELKGVLPSFELLYNLRTFFARANQFYGDLPQEFFNGSGSVINVDLSSNQFTGSIPSIRSTYLKVLNLSSNELLGTLPAEIGSCVLLDFSRNRIYDGLLPLEKWNSSLEFLDLSSNFLSGNFPDQISQLVSLTYFIIRNNSMQGSLPEKAFKGFQHLSTVDLSLNKLTGDLLPSFFMSENLTTLDLSGNFFSGSIPFQPLNSTEMKMEFLDLSDNSLFGSLSPDIKSLPNLKSLRLRQNSLSGLIPREIAKLEFLEFLDLSFNQFDGTIPNISQPNLKMLNVSGNDLSGPVPDSLKRFPESSFHPGNSLLGVTLSPPPSDSANIIWNPPEDNGKSRSTVIGIITFIGALLLIFLILMAVNRVRSQAHYSKVRNTPSSDTIVGKNSGKFFRSPRKGSTSALTSLPYDHLSNPTSRSTSMGDYELSSFADIPEPDSSVESHGMPDNFQAGIGYSYSSGSSSSFLYQSTYDQSAVLDVCQQFLGGELYLLNKSLVFTTDDLSDAPAEILGRSSYGISYKAILKNGHELTVKLLRFELSKQKREFSKEIKRIGSIYHRNIVPLTGFYWGSTEQERLVIYDFVTGDSLAVLLHGTSTKRRQRLSLKQRMRVAIDVARCLYFLHQEKCLPHGNLKPTNILLSGPNLTAQITDYGLHNLITSDANDEMVLIQGALGYKAPELETSTKTCPTYKSDTYAFGVILMELLTGRSAGDVISGQLGSVDLTDWVQKCAREGKARECYDPDISKSKEALSLMNEVLSISLRCILPVNERPDMKCVLESLCSIR